MATIVQVHGLKSYLEIFWIPHPKIFNFFIKNIIFFTKIVKKLKITIFGKKKGDFYVKNDDFLEKIIIFL
jgi:uncharacterized membrane protein